MNGYYFYGFTCGLAYCDRAQQAMAQNIERSFMYAGFLAQEEQPKKSEEDPEK